MKIKNLIEMDKQLQEELKDEDTCPLCAIHEAAQRTLTKNLICPHCGKENVVEFANNLIKVDRFAAVGEWYGDPEEDITILPIWKCYNCGKEIVLKPTRIIHNYNHDVYYTGKKHVLPKFDDWKFAEAIKPSVEQYLRRYKNEKDLTIDNVCLWIARDIEAQVRQLIEENYDEL